MIEKQAATVRIAIIGGGPSGLFMYKRLVASGNTSIEITVFEAGDRLGEGFPYSKAGANPEHVTNVSGNETPDIVLPVSEWIKTVPVQHLQPFGIDATDFNDYKVLPRLLFGKYLSAPLDTIQQHDLPDILLTFRCAIHLFFSFLFYICCGSMQQHCYAFFYCVGQVGRPINYFISCCRSAVPVPVKYQQSHISGESTILAPSGRQDLNRFFHN